MAPNSVRSVEVAGVGSVAAAATQSATSIAELISTVPQTWRPALGAHLTALYRTAGKLCTVQNTIVQYDRHVAEGSFPGSIVNSFKEPKLQFSKEFLGTELGSLAASTFASEVHSARKSLLACAVKRKQEELKSLQTMISFDDAAWCKLVWETSERVAQTFGARIALNPQNPKEPPRWSEGVPPAVQMDCKLLWEHGSVWHYRTVGLARSLSDRSLVEKTRTLSLKKDTDTKMRDADGELSTREVVRDEMQAQLRLLETRLAKTMSESSRKRGGSPLTLNRPAKQARSSQEQCEGRLERLPRREGTPQEEGQGQGTKVMTTQSFLLECSKEFRPWLPDTFPRVYNSLSLMTRVRIGFALSRIWEVDTLRASQPGVFKQPGLLLPEDIEYMLAVNHKFILHQAPVRHDVNEAKERFCRTVRNRWFFRGHANPEFIPKFHVPSPRWNPPKASAFIEQGLDAAMAVIDSQVSQALSTIATRPAVRKLSNWTGVQEFLADQGLLAKLTDKNLGLAVFSVSWYDATVLQLLADTTTYRPVFEVPVATLVQTLFDTLASWRLPPSMDKYIRARTKTQLPEFHAIPKVHKDPWTLRPIVPSHSWVTTSTSEVLDFLCQPLLEHYPWIVASSKEVINRLEKVRVVQPDPVWIMTGDVTAFYTNIPPKPCGKILAGLWKRFRATSSIPHSTIRSMVQFVMDNNFLEYRGQKFHQINGLAMGTACAPVVANLYAGFYEHKSRVVYQDGVLLYVRYIDDILCLFQGTREEAMEFTSGYSLGPLSIVWSVSSLRKEFLDIELIREPGLGLRVVHTRLFRKKMNRHLYIPWSSAHPLPVKKGFVKAELSRLAILCSKSEYFADARKEFYGNLRRRGYPVQTLREWFQQVHYGNRPILLLPKRDEMEQAPLMLPGHYNPVWDFVDVKEVITAARRFWMREELPESLQEPLIRSLGRTTSLFDLLSTWNKTTLLSSSAAERAAEVGLEKELARRDGR